MATVQHDNDELQRASSASSAPTAPKPAYAGTRRSFSVSRYSRRSQSEGLNLSEHFSAPLVDLEALAGLAGVVATDTAATAASGHDAHVPVHESAGLRSRRTEPHLGSTSANNDFGKYPHCFEYFASRREKEGSDYCLLLSWTSGERTHMIDIPVTDPEDEFSVYEEMRRQYYRKRGNWRKFCSLIDFKTLVRAEIRLGGLIDGEYLLVRSTPLNVSALRKSLKGRSDKWNKKCPDQSDLMSCYPYICREDFKTGRWNHDDPDCLANYPMIGDCPLERIECCRRRLVNLEGLWLMTACFQNPSLARQQKTLNVRFEKELIQRYSDIKIYSEYDSQPRDLVLQGVYVVEGWQRARIKHAIVIPSALTVCVVVVGRFLFGDWNTAFAAGSLFATWASLAVAILGYMSIK